MTPYKLEKKLIELTVNASDGFFFLYQLYANIETISEDPERFRPYFIKDPSFAYEFASNIDRGPKDCMREVCCKDPYYAYMYAIMIDKKARWDTYENLTSHYKEHYEESLGKP